MPTIRSTFYMFCADADVETTYPTAGIILNQGKEQTEAELCYISAIGAENQRRQSINVTGGRVNAIEILQTVCKCAKLDDWADFIAGELGVEGFGEEKEVQHQPLALERVN